MKEDNIIKTVKGRIQNVNLGNGTQQNNWNERKK